MSACRGEKAPLTEPQKKDAPGREARGALF
jgi:hypothetical protein